MTFELLSRSHFHAVAQGRQLGYTVETSWLARRKNKCRSRHVSHRQDTCVDPCHDTDGTRGCFARGMAGKIST